MNFRIILVRFYNRNKHTAKITPNDISDNSDNTNNEYHLELFKPIAPKRKRERPPGSKNKLKIAITNTTDVFVIQKKEITQNLPLNCDKKAKLQPQANRLNY
jgi:hypothetical protein